MKRRRLFTVLLSATAVTAPLGAPAQGRTYKVGFLMLDTGENAVTDDRQPVGVQVGLCIS